MEKEMGTENKLSTFSYIHPTMTKRMMQIQIGTQPIPLPSLAKCRTFVVSKKRLKSAGWRKSSRKEMAIASFSNCPFIEAIMAKKPANKPAVVKRLGKR